MEMEIEKKNGFVEFLKRYGMFFLVGIIIFAIALTFTLIAALHKAVPTGTTNLNFTMPMQNASVIKDFSNSELQYNDTLNQWEAHLYVDLTGENNAVYSILDGTVVSVQDIYLDGYTVTIQHADGFLSIYSSLNKNVLVEKGDAVSAGQQIGEVDNTARGELNTGSHLHFAMKQNNAFVDPNNYLALQVK